MKLDLIQGSEKWLEYRRSKIGASDSGAILGLNPHKSPNEVWLSKQPNYVDQDNPRMRQGREREPQALRLFEIETGHLMSPIVIESKETSFLIASLDGYEIEEKCAVEIKCGGEKLHIQSIHGEIPKYYIAQMQHQMYVAELDEIYYCSYRPEHVVNPIYIEIIKRDEAFIENMIEKLTDFYFDHMLTGVPPKKEEKFKNMDIDNGVVLTPEMVSKSEQWKTLSNEYMRIDRQMKELEKSKEGIKDLLLQVSNMENARGNGITLTKVERKGMINYQNIPILKTMDLEEFRKPNTTFWQVKELNEIS